LAQKSVRKKCTPKKIICLEWSETVQVLLQNMTFQDCGGYISVITIVAVNFKNVTGTN
jgi:hypothetical protein